jgi:hypothetical protein
LEADPVEVVDVAGDAANANTNTNDTDTPAARASFETFET